MIQAYFSEFIGQLLDSYPTVRFKITDEGLYISASTCLCEPDIGSRNCRCHQVPDKTGQIPKWGTHVWDSTGCPIHDLALQGQMLTQRSGAER